MAILHNLIEMINRYVLIILTRDQKINKTAYLISDIVQREDSLTEEFQKKKKRERKREREREKE